MNRNERFSTKHILIGISMLCILLMVLTWESRSSITPMEKSIAHVIIPVQKGISYFGDWLSDRVSFITSIRQLEDMNRELLEQVDRLDYENSILKQTKLELDRLRELYELDQRYADYPKMGARVIGKDPGNWYNRFIIDKGEEDGVAVDMVVMAGAGLAGRVMEAGPGYAKVKAIIDDTSSVSAKVLRTSDLCIVKGDKSLEDYGTASIEYIPDEVNLVVGDEIVTSHLGSIYPPGILVGRVSEIIEQPHRMTKRAILEPVVDFKHLEEVLVIDMVYASQEDL